MAFLGVVLTIVAALIIGLIFYYALELTGPWGTFWSFLVVVTLAGLAAEAWFTPVGPVKWGIAWIPTLFVMFLIALLLAAATPVVRKSRKEKDTGQVPSEKIQNQAALGGFFWLLLVILLSIILWGVIGEHSL